MLSAAQRQAKLAKKKKVKVQKQRAAADTAIREREAERQKQDSGYYRIIADKREELFGLGLWFGDDTVVADYTPEQCAHVDAIVNAYTPEEFAAALAQANELNWESDYLDECFFERRVEQRLAQGRKVGITVAPSPKSGG
jgi:hypothetical protein